MCEQQLEHILLALHVRGVQTHAPLFIIAIVLSIGAPTKAQRKPTNQAIQLRTMCNRPNIAGLVILPIFRNRIAISETPAVEGMR